MSGDVLALIGTVAVIVVVALVARESLRPPLTSDWRERDFGDHPNVPRR